MRNEEVICTCCGWVGDPGEMVEHDGHEACPECISECEPMDEEPDEELENELSMYDDMPDLYMAGNPEDRRPARDWLAHMRQRTGGYYPAKRVGQQQEMFKPRTVTASIPRQELLKGCLSHCLEVGLSLAASKSVKRQAEGQAMLRATGRVCVSEVDDDPCST